MTDIAIINESTVATDAEIIAAVGAIGTQITRDYMPAYGMSANLHFFSKGSNPIASMWWVAVLDNSDQAGALGYHDLTSTGLPLGKVFAASDKQFGDSVSVTLSHEVLEMLMDPFINLTALMGDGKFYAFEACDAVEADGLGYAIDGVQVSDFVLPAYFQPSIRLSDTKWDFCGHLTGACPQITAQGYLSVYDPASGQWSQITAEEASVATRLKARAPLGSRRHRRTIPFGERILSER
jgi:hypothetical protein